MNEERFNKSLKPNAEILVVDDAPEAREVYGRLLMQNDYKTKTVSSLKEMRQSLELESFDVIVLDIKLADGDGLDHIPEILTLSPMIKIIVLTGNGSVETAVKAMKAGASGFVQKSSHPEELVTKIKETLRLNLADVRSLHQFYEKTGFATANQQIARIVESVAQLKHLRSPILISGEKGVGKKHLASAIATEIDRKPVIIDCATASPKDLQEKERSLLILDDIAKLPLESQNAIAVATDLEYIALAQSDLQTLSSQRLVIESWAQKLSLIEFRIPPLRHRRDDIDLLVDHYVEVFNQKLSRNISHPSLRMINRLKAYNWPGNVAELKNAIERAMILAPNQRMKIENILPYQEITKHQRIGSNSELENIFESLPLNFVSAKKEFEKIYLNNLLKLTGGSISEASRLSGQYRANIYRMLNKHGIRKEENA